MTTEEKLEHFLKLCTDDANGKAGQILDDFTAALQKVYDDHRQDANRRAKMLLQAETDKIERDINKQLSVEQINIKRTLGQKQDELKDMLFVEVKARIEDFMDTPAYTKMLETQIRDAQSFADGADMVVYMDPADSQLLQRIAMHTGANIKLSQYSFFGGTRAVIASKNILIDNSFETKLAEAKQNFQFRQVETGGRAHA